MLILGDSEIDEIFKIFRVLGTPSEDVWRGVSQLPDFKADFPKWPQIGLEKVVPSLCIEGLDLLSVDTNREIIVSLICFLETVNIRPRSKDFS